MFIGMKYVDKKSDGFLIKNVPCKEWSTLCDSGCGERMVTKSLKTSIKCLIIQNYMERIGLTEYDFNDWNDELEQMYQEHAKKYKKGD
jgi:hypothetical protein